MSSSPRTALARLESPADRHELARLDDLFELTDCEDIDLLVLNDAGPLAREQALVGGRPLYQWQPVSSPTPRSRPSWNGWTPIGSAGRNSN